MAEMSGDRGKKRGIDDIIDHMTADLQSYDGQYIFMSAQPGTHPVWNNFPQQQPQASPQAFFPQQITTQDMYRYVVIGKTNSPDYNQQVGFIYQRQPNLIPSHMEYPTRSFTDGSGGGRGCLIENVVGNWAPNLNGTYSPFGAPMSKDETANIQPQPSNPQPSAPVKKHRIVAEVKPMRPSYSDVVAKSPPLTPPPTVKQTVKPIITPNNAKSETNKQKNSSKTAAINQGSGKGNGGLRRQNSSGSDDGLGGGKQKSTLDHWSSVEDLTGFGDSSYREKPAEECVRKKKKSKSIVSKPVPEKSEKPDIFKAFENSYTMSQNSPSDTPHSSDNESPSVGKVGSGQTPRNPGERVNVKPRSRDKEDRKGSSSKSERLTNSARGGNSKNKRSQRAHKKRESSFGILLKKWQEQSSYFVVFLTTWLVNLLWDVTAMSASLFVHMCGVVYEHSVNWVKVAKDKIFAVIKKWKWWGKKNTRFQKKSEAPPLPGSLTHNITLPATGEEAMKRLLSCKGKDPYSILGVTSTCTDEEIKKYYKSQALLVHPDKNSQPGAEEAFKILVHAFDLIAEPEKRAAYDRYVAETNQVEQAWSELSDLLTQLHEKMEYAANTIRCNNCGKRHKREMTDRPSYAARYCAQCKIHHAAKEGDMWAESRFCGWSCRYYACMGGSVYDITQWANCQGGGVQRVKPDAHSVQYRVLLGRHQPPQPEQDFEDLLNSLYSQNGSGKRGKKKPKKK